MRSVTSMDFIRPHFRGFSALSGLGYWYSVHSIIESNTVDNPEAVDILVFKRGNMTISPCQALNPEFALAKLCSEQGSFHTSQLLSSAGPEYFASEKVSERSMLPIKSVWAGFPSMLIHTRGHNFRLFGFKPMCCSLGIPKLLKECLVPTLKEESNGSTRMITVKGAGTEFSQIWKTVLIAINSFLLDFEKCSPGYHRRVDYFKGESASSLSGFFNHSGIVRNLEASSCNVTDMESPLIAESAGQFWGLDCVWVTKAFTSYVDVINLIYRRRRKPEWTENEFQLL